MLKWFKRLLAKYDAWCLSMGLTPDKTRNAVASLTEVNPPPIPRVVIRRNSDAPF